MFFRPVVSLFLCFFDELYEFIDTFFSWIPGRTGRFIRLLYFSILFRKILSVHIGTNVRIRGIKGIVFGNEVSIGDNCIISAKSGGKCVFGNNVALNVHCHLNADISGTIILGDDSIFGPSCVFRASNHKYGAMISPKYLPHQSGSIFIGEGVWCGANGVFLRGASVPPFSVIGASAVVCKSFSERALLVGIPASIKRLL